MTDWLDLTGDDGKPTHVAVDHILYLRPSTVGKGTLIHFAGRQAVGVSQSMAEIRGILTALDEVHQAEGPASVRAQLAAIMYPPLPPLPRRRPGIEPVEERPGTPPIISHLMLCEGTGFVARRTSDPSGATVCIVCEQTVTASGQDWLVDAHPGNPCPGGGRLQPTDVPHVTGSCHVCGRLNVGIEYGVLRAHVAPMTDADADRITNTPEAPTP